MEDKEIKWEWIDAGFLERTKVPWGWIVRGYAEVVHDRSEDGGGMANGWDWRIAMCFVFDPFHWWKVNI